MSAYQFRKFSKMALILAGPIRGVKLSECRFGKMPLSKLEAISQADEYPVDRTNGWILAESKKKNRTGSGAVE